MKSRDLLLGEFREFKRASLQWQKSVDSKLDSLSGFKMKITGIAIGVAAIASIIVDLLRH